MDKLQTLLDMPWIRTLIGCLLLIVVAWLAALLARLLLRRTARILSRTTPWRWDSALVARGVFRQLARMLPMLAIHYGIVLIPGLPAWIDLTVARITTALVIVFLMLAISAALSALGDLHQASPRGKERSIKGYVQLGKIFAFVFGAIIIIAILINKSALTLLAGLGAVSAVLLLIFKDTILSVVASVQLGSDDMLRVGDWIVLPEDNVDGDVTEIALHTIKVVNWDKTISTVPTWHLISKSFRNYRNMYATGRRIRRALYIDITSVRFLDQEEITHLRKFRLLDEYFARKEKDLAEWNAELGDSGKLAINQRRLSNLGSFRAYMQAYVAANPKINHDLFWAVRQLDPSPTGIPMQIYAYTVNTSFVPHHDAQDDIFDHLIAILPEFGLALFQQPTGKDLRAGIVRLGGDDLVNGAGADANAGTGS